MNIEELEKILYDCYSKDLCYYKVQNEWNESNKYLGMCAITALIVNDYFGGTIGKIYVNGISHYFNIINNKIIDLTKKQFNFNIDYSKYQLVDRKDLLTEDTKNRYNILKDKLIKYKKNNNPLH